MLVYPDEILLAIPYHTEYYEGWINHDTEYLKVRRRQEHYKLSETPLYAHDLAVGDIVSVVYDNGTYFFNGIIEESGYSSLRLNIYHKHLCGEITDMISGLQGEIKMLWGPDLLRVDVPSHVDYAPIKEYLDAVSHKRHAGFWETCIRKKHRFDLRTMDKFNFWDLIEESYKQSHGDKEQQITILTDLLQQFDTQVIIEFEKIFRELVIQADTYKVMAALKIVDGFVTDDSYLYFRCRLISRGRAFFNDVLENPDYLANYDVSITSDIDHEELMYVATRAYRKKTGIEKEDDTFPRSIAYAAGLDYDFGAPPTKGTDWTEEELPVLLPRLWQQYLHITHS
ncbi:DUF4240 domain-containing protein [Chitinophaga pinensis]|uniref:DUF4240 domain-containing protein n=1 Tax=Chitinophaga pinensis (strain ATCC 43595 / DSM 2588 / LMG 13176 / NBRC 15968 / NCIMB 11800 / UQM 2034) TaxID=485918 RepID=A0A979G6K5_CHIPD|nr:DUF4240 domain-containing protein [Chitinophaga pinensis]ACU61800.1 hypothetical protein Cpin_4353 [Chitinophaga pinensis DSM 2588]